MTRFSGGDRRQHPRRSTSLSATLIHKDVPIQGCKVDNLGFGGAHISLPMGPPPEGGTVQLILQDESGHTKLRVEGICRHVDGYRCGVQFHKLAAKDFDALADLMFSWMSRVTLRVPEKSRQRPTDVPGGHTFWN